MKLLTKLSVSTWLYHATAFVPDTYQQAGFCGVPMNTEGYEDILQTSYARVRRDASDVRTEIMQTMQDEDKDRDTCKDEVIAELDAQSQLKSAKPRFAGRNGVGLPPGMEVQDVKYKLGLVGKYCIDKEKEQKNLPAELEEKYQELTNEWIAENFLDLLENEQVALAQRTLNFINTDLSSSKGAGKRCFNTINKKLAQKMKKDSQTLNIYPSNQENEVLAAHQKQSDECGADDLKVVGGVDARAHAWPWQVYLSICGTFYGMMECNVCGGSIISNNWILTAAHCVPFQARGRIFVGAQDLNVKNYTTYGLGPMYKHPRWNTPGRFQNDIALTKAYGDESIDINWTTVSPICLPSEGTCFTDETTCVVTGWGLMGERGDIAEILQAVGVKLISHEQCRGYAGYGSIPETMLCAGFESGQQDACAGDSGGPLVCRVGHGSTKGTWVLHGIVSWGYGCARPNSPGIYTDVKAYTDWIAEFTGEQGTQVIPDPDLVDDDVCSSDIAEDDKDPATFMHMPKPLLDYIQENQDVEVIEECDYDNISDGLRTFFLNEAIELRVNGEDQPRSATEQRDPTDVEINYSYAGTRGKKMPTTSCKWIWQTSHPERYIDLDITADLSNVCNTGDDSIRLSINYVDKDGKEVRDLPLCNVAAGDAARITSKQRVEVIFQTNTRTFAMTEDKDYSFNVKWMFEDTTWHCGDQPRNLEFNANSGVQKITSPQYPQRYESQQQCRFEIKSTVDLDFNVLINTEKQRICDRANDNVIFYLADSCDSANLYDVERHRIYGVLCGRQRRRFGIKRGIAGGYQTNDASKLQLCVVFIGDNDNNHGNGFEISIAPRRAPPPKRPKKKQRKPKRKNRRRG